MSAGAGFASYRELCEQNSAGSAGTGPRRAPGRALQGSPENARMEPPQPSRPYGPEAPAPASASRTVRWSAGRISASCPACTRGLGLPTLNFMNRTVRRYLHRPSCCSGPDLRDRLHVPARPLTDIGGEAEVPVVGLGTGCPPFTFRTRHAFIRPTAAPARRSPLPARSRSPGPRRRP